VRAIEVAACRWPGSAAVPHRCRSVAQPGQVLIGVSASDVLFVDAQLAAAELDDVAAVPEGAELPHATAVLHDGTTALRILEAVSIPPGQWVLILGAAGGMGILPI
jgi:D-arabinose 1-dehydrogenase-like Zn-dependent alcohol dehydrogenase